MKKYLALFGLLFGLAGLSYAGTPQETYFSGQGPLSGTSIYASTASVTSVGTYTLTVATPTAINGAPGRNCFTRFFVQIPTTTVVGIANNTTTLWTINGLGLGSSGVNTLQIIEDHLAPFCTTAGNSTVFTLTNTLGSSLNPSIINVEGYVTYGGGSTNNAGSMQ